LTSHGADERERGPLEANGFPTNGLRSPGVGASKARRGWSNYEVECANYGDNGGRGDAIGVAGANPGVYTKAIVAERIRQVENGVDEFREYLEHRGEDTKDRAEAAESSGSSRRRTGASTHDVRKGRAKQSKSINDLAICCGLPPMGA
jgi:hypothetical protein